MSFFLIWFGYPNTKETYNPKTFKMLQPLFIKILFLPKIDISFKKTSVSKLNTYKTVDAYLTAYLINIKSNTLSNRIKL